MGSATERVESTDDIGPLGSRVVIRPLDPGKMTESGLIEIPLSAQEDRRLAEVIAVGPGAISPYTGMLIEPRVKVGWLVLTVMHRGVDLHHGDDDRLKIIDESDCMCRVLRKGEAW